MIALLSLSSISYGMEFNGLEFFADLIARDPLDLWAARRALEIRKTTQEINRDLRTAAKIERQSNGYYKLVENRGAIKVVQSADLHDIFGEHDYFLWCDG